MIAVFGGIDMDLVPCVPRFPDPGETLTGTEVEIMDNTTAGGAFNGALAWALQTEPLEEAIVREVIAGALAMTKRGVRESIPDLRAKR